MRAVGFGRLGMSHVEIGHVDGVDAVLHGPEVIDLCQVDLAQLPCVRHVKVLEVDVATRRWCHEPCRPAAFGCD